MRELLECNFNYLYIAGTGKEYKLGKKGTKVYDIDGHENEVVFNGDGVI